MWLGVVPWTNTKKKDVFQRGWTTCSQYNIHSRFDNQHNWERDLYDHLMSAKIFTLILNQIFIYAPNIMRKAIRALIWIGQLSRTYCMFSYHKENGLFGKRNHLRLYLPYKNIVLKSHGWQSIASHMPKRWIWNFESTTEFLLFYLNDTLLTLFIFITMLCGIDNIL